MAPPASLVSHALRLLAGRPHASAELTRKLKSVCARRRVGKRASVRDEYAHVDCDAAAAETVALLANAGGHELVDDNGYAAWHVAQRSHSGVRSRSHVAAELRSKGVSAAITTHATREYDDLNACVAAMKRRAGRAKSAQHLMAALARAGFHAGTIAQAQAIVQAEAAAVQPLR